jgi:tetratricopeptide (TPR) repeat protein
VDPPDRLTGEQWLTTAMDAGHSGAVDPDRVHSVLPARPDRIRDAAVLLSRRDQPALAESLFLEARDLDPTMVVAYARALVRWNRPLEALPLVEPLENNCYAQNVAGQTLLVLKRPADAVAAYERALAVCGAAHRPARAGLGRARLMSGDQRGEKILLQLLADEPTAYGVRRGLLGGLRMIGDARGMRPHLDYLVEVDVATARERRERACMVGGAPPVTCVEGVD